MRRLSEIVQKLERKPIEGLQAVVVDSLRGLLSAHGADENDSGAVRDILGMLATIAESGPGVLVLHHFRRDREAAKGDRMRGSGDILVVCPRNDLAVARTWPNGSSNGDSGPNRRNASQIKRQLVQGTHH